MERFHRQVVESCGLWRRLRGVATQSQTGPQNLGASSSRDLHDFVLFKTTMAVSAVQYSKPPLSWASLFCQCDTEPLLTLHSGRCSLTNTVLQRVSRICPIFAVLSNSPSWIDCPHIQRFTINNDHLRNSLAGPSSIFSRSLTSTAPVASASTPAPPATSADPKISKIVDDISGLTLLQAADLVTLLKVRGPST